MRGTETNPEFVAKCVYSTRLGKCFDAILADRGFAKYAMYYPNLNNHITPRFIAGRKQFSAEDRVERC